MADIRRITDTEELNDFANRPETLPFVTDNAPGVDLSAFFDRPGNVAYEGGGGCMLFAYAGNGVFEGHYLFPKEVRGAEALRIAARMIHEVFTTDGAHAIYGDISRSNRAARSFTRALGFHRIWSGRRDNGEQYVRYYMTRIEWATLYQG